MQNASSANETNGPIEDDNRPMTPEPPLTGTSRPGRNQALTLLAAGLVIGLSLLGWLPLDLARLGAVGVLAAQIWLEIKTGRKSFMTSPPFLLGSMSLFFFSFTQGLAGAILESPNMDFITYIGSNAERIVLIFGITCVVTHIIVNNFNYSQYMQDTHNKPVRINYIDILFLLLSLILTIVSVGYYSGLYQGSSYYPQIRFIFPPLQAFMIIHLLRSALKGGTAIKVLAALVFVLAIAGMFAVQEGKIPIFITVSASLYWLRLKRVSIRKVLIGGIGFVLLIIAMLQVAQAIRTPHASLLGVLRPGETSTARFWHVIAWKSIWRQTETGYCLKNVMNSHWEQPFSVSRQMFWLKGLVPRALWPDKPSLSLGGDYTTRYCGFPVKGRNSSSITLLGQPIIQGGGAGLLLHGTLLLIGLAGIAWLNRDPWSLSTSTVTALLPWLIDFDQDFAMYVANFVKFSLVMSPLVFLAGLSQYMSSRTGICDDAPGNE